MKKSILFVCTGNIFRSMTAEYLLKHFFHNVPLIDVSSAGIEAESQKPNLSIVEEFNKIGVDISNHVQRKVTDEILADSDLTIAMSTKHQTVLSEDFQVDSYLFNEVAFGRKEALQDINEVVLDWETNEEKKNEYARAMFKYINYSIPYLVKNLNKYLGG